MRWIIPLVIALAICFPFVATKYVLTVAILGLIYVLLGLGLNIVVGLAGLLDLGYVAFYAIGAYGLALGYQYLGLGFWSMLPLAAIMAAPQAPCSVSRYCACTVTIWPSSPSGLGRLFA